MQIIPARDRERRRPGQINPVAADKELVVAHLLLERRQDRDDLELVLLGRHVTLHRGLGDSGVSAYLEVEALHALREDDVGVAADMDGLDERVGESCGLLLACGQPG